MGRIKEAVMEHHSKCSLCGSEDVQEDVHYDCMYCNNCNRRYDLLTGLEKLKEEQEEEDEPEYWWQKGQYK